MITCPNCRTIYPTPVGQCSECGRYLSGDTGNHALNMQLMGQVDRANRDSRAEGEIRSPMSRRTGVVGSQVGVPESTVAAARGVVGQLFRFGDT